MGEVGQWVKKLAAKPDSLSLMSEPTRQETIERSSCVWYGCVTSQLKILWPIGNGRIESGTCQRQREFWAKNRQGRFAQEDVTRQTHGT